MAKIINNSKKKKETRAEERFPVYLVKLPAEIKIEEGGRETVESSQVFLNDLSTNGAGFFLEHRLPSHTNISILIKKPRSLFVKGTVIWCNRFNYDSKIISSNKFLYRAGIKFRFADEKEKEEVKLYISTLLETLEKEF